MKLNPAAIPGMATSSRITKHLIIPALLLLGSGLSACSVPAPALLEGPLAPLASTKTDKAEPFESSLKWWTILGDPALDSLAEKALANNFSIQAAALRLQEANSTETTTLFGLGPKTSVDMRAGRTETQEYSSNNPYSAPNKGTLPTNTGAFRVSWELPLFGKAQAITAYGKAQVEQSHWQLEAAKLAVTSELVRAYAQWQGLVDNGSILAQSSRYLDELIAAEKVLQFDYLQLKLSKC